MGINNPIAPDAPIAPEGRWPPRPEQIEFYFCGKASNSKGSVDLCAAKGIDDTWFVASGAEYQWIASGQPGAAMQADTAAFKTVQ